VTTARAKGWSKAGYLLASPKLTLALLALLGFGVVLTYQDRVAMTWPLAIPLFALALNLMAAVATNPNFRRQTPLLLFHLALIVLMLLAGLGRLTYLKARVEVTEGQAFDGVPVEIEQGPLHPWRLDRVRFINERFVIEYSAEVTIRATANEVRWQDASGRWQKGVISENTPLSIFGYRFYVTSGKGFAPVFTWRSGDAEPVVGAIHLPKFPSDEYAQQTEWILPDGKTAAWVRLHLDRPMLVAGAPSQLKAPPGNRVVLRLRGSEDGTDERFELRPGQSLALPGGVLEYQGLRLWMGYLVYYDWTIPWLLAVSVLAVIALAWHFYRKFERTPW
jgi:cytochrome c biogenesis protein ResB